MGIGSFIKKNGKHGKGAKALRKMAKRKLIKAEKEKNIVVEETELLSKAQLKKLARQPTNNIRPSGKRKRKMLKRLRHSQKEKNQMDVESGSVASGSKVKDSTMETDEEMSDDEQTTEDVEMT